MQIFQKTKHIVLSYVIMTLGVLIYTFGWSAFLLPSKIIAGGVTGISSTIYFLTGEVLPVGVLNFILNAILVIFGFKFLGSKYGVNTIYGIIMSSLGFIFWQQLLNVGILFDVKNIGIGMCAVIGGALCGVGIGMTFSVGGNSGGTDIIALILSKYYNISPGKVILYLDIFIVGCSYFVTHSLNNIVMGYIVMVVMTYVLDNIVDGRRQSYQIMVFSSKAAEIGEVITREVGRGATLLSGHGCYTGQENQTLVIMAHRTDKPLIMQIIHRVDANAFIAVSKAQGVYGKNFDKLKL